LDGVDLDIPRGALFVLLGPNGAGKTTLMRCITGLARPTAGELSVLGSRGGDRSHLGRIGVLIENPGVYGRLTAREYLGFFASFYGLADAQARIAGICREFGIPLDGKPCGKLSQGNRQKLHLARSVLHRPELLLWDEPTDHLDPDSQRETLGYLGRYLRETGATALMATHRLEQMESVGTHFGFLGRGRLKAAGERSAILDGGAAATGEVRLGFAAPPGREAVARLAADFSARILPPGPDPRYVEMEAPDMASRLPALLRAAIGGGLELASAEPRRATLADAYRRHLGDDR
jgi:ABC-type multidrug transport system ATPase subunit